MDFDKIIDAAGLHILKGKQGDILRLPGVMYLDCRTNLALQVRDLYNHVRTEIHQLSNSLHSGLNNADLIFLDGPDAIFKVSWEFRLDFECCQ